MVFGEIVGHQHVLRLLAGAVLRNSLPPSLIFAGPSRVGKAAVASALAQVLNCEQLAEGAPPGPFDACGECVACRRLARAVELLRSGGGRMPMDCLQWLAPDEKESIKIDPVREVLGRAGFRPFDGRRRLVVVDDADCLEVPAQQALLKMLEEPPPATTFVLLTSRPHALLATVRSRCPQLRFAPIPASDIAKALTDRGWAPAEAESAAALADGQFGVALERRQGQVDHQRAVAAEVLERVAQSRSALDRLEAAQAFVARAEGSKGATARKGAVTRHEVASRLDAMGALLRDVGVLATRADPRWVHHVDLIPQLGRLATVFAGDRLTRAFDVVDRARAALDRNASQKIVADWLLLNL